MSALPGTSSIPLSFYEHARQSYGSQPLRGKAVAEFMVGDYGEKGEPDEGVGRGGEFAIRLYDLGNRSGTRPLSPKLEVFSDAFGSLAAFMEVGAADLLAKCEIWTADDLTSVLLGAGLYDRSDYAVPFERCKHCFGSGKVNPEKEAQHVASH